MTFQDIGKGRVYNCDCLDLMALIPENCVDLTLTSPPYDDLRDYNGFIFDFEKVAQELFRITAQGGVVVWVVGDQIKNGTETGTSFKQALYLKACGFNLHDTMIYQRLAMPNQAKRYSQDFEFMFVFVKGTLKTFNPLTEDCIWAGVGTSPTTRDKDGTLKSKGRRIIKPTKKRSNIWRYSVGKGKSSKDPLASKHPAIFPEALAEDHVRSWSNPGDFVFDPFGGSGTTAIISEKLLRRWATSEISEEYYNLSIERILKNAN